MGELQYSYGRSLKQFKQYSVEHLDSILNLVLKGNVLKQFKAHMVSHYKFNTFLQ